MLLILSDMFRKIGIYAFFILFPLLAAGVVTFNFRYEIRGMLLSDYIDYEQVEGEIVRSIESIDGGRYVPVRVAEITYMYEVNNKYYQSQVISFSHDMSRVEYYLDKYPVGKKIVIFYDKNAPEYSVLEPEKKDYTLILLPPFLIAIFVTSYFGGGLCRRYQWCDRLLDWLDAKRMQ